MGKTAMIPNSSTPARIMVRIAKRFPPNTNHQYSEREERPLKLKEFDTPLFMASMIGIILAGRPVTSDPSIIPLSFMVSIIKFEPSSDSFNQRMNEFNSLAVEFMYPRSK